MERLGGHGLQIVVSLIFPCGDIHKVVVVAEGFAILGLVFGTEMAATRLFAVHSIGDDEACQFEIVGQAIGFFQFGVKLLGCARDGKLTPEIGLEFLDLLHSNGEALGVARHAPT